MRDDFYRKVVARREPFIIAEIGANHNGDMKLARELIGAAAACGCDAVKFQSWTPRSIISAGEYERHRQYHDDPKKHWGSLYEMVERYYLRPEQHRELNDYCSRKGIVFSSTPFSPEEADMLEELDVPFFKAASMDLNNPTLLRYIAGKGRPIILSTGMGDLDEIKAAVDTIQEAGNREVILLHCVALYPPDDAVVNLRNISMLKEAFGLPVGFSDHTFGTSIPLAAIALGAKVIEKHFTLDKTLPGWDHAVSADPGEMRIIVEEGKRIAGALGERERVLSEKEIEQRKAFRRSIVSKRDLKEGEVISEGDLDFKRPGTGLSPDKVGDVVGKKLKRDIKADRIINREDLR